MTPLRLTAIVAMLSAFPVSADDLVDRADANGDGYVSLYELRAAYYADMEFNRRIEQSFAEYDTDGDGLISEAERRAQAVATTKTVPPAGTTSTASGEIAVIPSTGAAPAAAAGTQAETLTEVAPIPTAEAQATTAMDVEPTSAVESSEAVAAVTQAAAVTEVTPTPAAEAQATTAMDVEPASAVESSKAAAGEVASIPAAETASVGTSGMDTGADSSGGGSAEVSPATNAAGGASPETRRLSRTESWIQKIDIDNSGGASMKELVASGDGEQWFPDSAFDAADKNEDGDLDPDELEVLLRSMERRHRR